MCVLCMNCWNLNRKPNLFFLHSHSRSDTDPVRLHLFIVIYNKCVKLFVNTTCVCEMLCLSLGVWGQVWRCVKSHFLNISCVAAVLFLGGSLIFSPPLHWGIPLFSPHPSCYHHILWILTFPHPPPILCRRHSQCFAVTPIPVSCHLIIVRPKDSVDTAVANSMSYRTPAKPQAQQILA